MQVLTELDLHRRDDCSGVTELEHFTIHLRKQVPATEQITGELAAAELEAPRLCDEDEDVTVLFEQMENAIPIMYSGTKPRKSAERPP